MSWRIARSLVTLLGQVNVEFPNRRRDSDGGIGDERHQAERTSDHNPYIVVVGMGVVRAYDFTHAPETGFDSYAFAETLRLNRDSRVRYVISNRRISSGHDGPSPWLWRPYHGTNDHAHHAHVSVTENRAEFDSPVQWNLGGLTQQIESYGPVANNYVPPPATLRIGSRGDIVKRLQTAVGATTDGFFGKDETFLALKKYQTDHGLVSDGVCGPATWRVIGY